MHAVDAVARVELDASVYDVRCRLAAARTIRLHAVHSRGLKFLLDVVECPEVQTAF